MNVSHPVVIVEPRALRARYGAVLATLARETERIGAALARKVAARRALVISAYSANPDQSTLWWYDQGLLSLLAAAGMDLTYATDASYALDDQRLDELGAKLRRLGLAELDTLDGSFDFVVGMTPSDSALAAAARFAALLVAVGVKSVGHHNAPLTLRPAPGTTLWHGFTNDPDYVGACEGHLGPGFGSWKLRGAPFPVNRYYFPPLRRPPRVDAVLLGSKDRDIELVCAALREAGVRRFVALANPEDTEHVERVAAAHHLAVRVLPPQRHLELLAVLESARMVVNPITSKSHYSFVAPLALGIPVVATDSAASRVFVHGDRPAVVLAPAGDVSAWAARIAALLDDQERSARSASALAQIRERHDLDRFLASAIVETLASAA